MNQFQQHALPHKDLKGLVWLQGDLVAAAYGFARVPLDGSPIKRTYSGYGRNFDSACIAPREDVVVLVETSGTKGLVLSADGKVLREINRSYYCADVYRYPAALFTLPSGRTGLAHCPDEYNRVEIEDAVSGERLTSRAGEEQDFFHSRLQVSDHGKYLLSAGWIWHPWSALCVYDVHKALKEPGELSGSGSVFDPRGLIQAEVGGACFVGDDVAITTTSDENDPDSDDDLAPNMLARWSADKSTFVWRKQLAQPVGDVLNFHGDLLTLRGHPRLYSGADGSLLYEWSDLATGDAECSIVWDRGFSGPARVAVDPRLPRFAVTDGESVIVVTKAE